MTIKIHGNEYVTVAERVKAIHDGEEKFDITTELLASEPVVIKATVKTEKGTFTGISSANPLKTIEKTNPYEVAETSAVGRALGFANYGLNDSIASADEMVKAGGNVSVNTQKAVTTQSVVPQGSGLPHTPQQDRTCEKCGGEMWNNIGKKTNPAAPDYKCKDKDCGGVIWPKKELPEIQIEEQYTNEGQPEFNDDDIASYGG